MDNWFKSKWFVRVVSLIFAVSLYVFVSIEVDSSNDDSRILPGTSSETQILEDVPLEIRIDSEKYVVSGVPEYVTVTLEGPTHVLTPIARQQSFSVFIDLEELDEGEHTVEVEYTNVPDDLSVYIEPKTVDITIEERASEEFPINIDIINEDKLPVGYELGEPQLNPETVTITSSRQIIDQIAMVKVFVDVSGLTESINNRELPINIYDSQGNELNVRIEPENTVLSMEVNNPSKVVPLNVPTRNELPEGYELVSLEPTIDEVQVFATTEVLAELETVSTEPVDLSEITETGTIQVPLDLPGNVASNTEEIEISVELEQTKELEDIAIQVEGMEEDNYTFITPQTAMMNVIAVGNDMYVNGLESNDIEISINLDGLLEGEHHIPVSVTGPEYVTIETEYEEVILEVSD